MKQLFTIMIAMTISMTTFAQFVSTSASTVASMSGANVAWTTGASSSTASLGKGASTNDLSITGFTFTNAQLGNNDNVTSISVTITASANAANNISENQVQLIINSSIVANSNAVVTPNNWTTTPTQYTYNFPVSTMGLKGSAIKAGGFGVVISAKRTSSINASYTATISNSATVKVGTGALAPIILTDFAVARNADNHVDIRFATSTEDNVKELYVQRSANGKDFQTLFTLQPKGAANVYTKYAVVDKSPLQGANYYRVAEMDKNGRWYYYITRVVNFDGTAQAFNAHFNGGQVVTNISNKPGMYEVSLIDMSGITVTRKQVNMTGKSAQLMLDAPSRGGIYILTLKGQGVAESTRVAIIK